MILLQIAMRLGEKLRYLRLVEGTLRGFERAMTQAEVSRTLKRELKDSISQAYLSQIESGAWTAITEDVLGRIARALGVEPWVILAQAAGLKVDQVERFSEDERRWLDAYRALDPEQRETMLRVATVMRRPSPRRRTE